MPCRPLEIPDIIFHKIFRRGTAATIPAPDPTPDPPPPPGTFSIEKTSPETQTLYGQYVTTPFADKWPGYQGETIDVAHTYTVNTNTAFGTAYTNAKNNAGAGVWQKIIVQSGVTSMFMGEADFFPHLGGGLLVVPETSFLKITGLVVNNSSGVPRGLQLGLVGQGFHFCSTTAGGNGQIRFNLMTGANRAIAKIQGNRFGLMFSGMGYTPDTEALYTAAVTCILCQDGEDIQIIDNIFSGFKEGAKIYNVRLAEVARNDFQQFAVDCIDYNAFCGVKEWSKGVNSVYPDDHQYIWIHHNTARNILDWYGFVPAVSGPHSDFIQRQTQVSYPGVTPNVVVGAWRAVNGNYYLATQGGTVGSGTAPTGTGLGQTDGTVIWDYICPISEGPGSFATIESNTILAAAQAYGDYSGARYGQTIAVQTDSDGGGRGGVLVLNNIEGTRSSYGFQSGGNIDFARAEFNTFGPTSEIMPSGGFSVFQTPNLFTAYTGANKSLFYCANNISGANAQDNGANTVNCINIKLDGIGAFDPGNVLAGTFLPNSDGYYRLNYSDTGTDTPAEFRAALYEQLKPLDGAEIGAFAT